MNIYGLIGYPLSHSFSENYFNKKFNIEKIKDSKYINFPIENISEFKDLVKHNKNLYGLNVTIPYKESIINYLDKLDDSAKEIGAVNTIKIERLGNSVLLTGYNTDFYGFYESLIPYINKQIHTHALILGTGGASKAVAYVLKKLNIKYKFVSRSKSSAYITYSELNEYILQKYKLIVNTTPLGMFPSINSFPDINYSFLSNNHIAYDLVYNPDKTLFLEKAENQKAVIINGLKMLHLQAEKAWQIFRSSTYL